ncbi:hypothetical protein G3O06_23440 [Burkholderia sp. Ac-20345]|uniref:hypothetical protein n=1 Tax=Burkholderia sp. Ac-20345 TaxID=2703891 RepID=UPI00197BC5CD|nr:hypothetical protein [Burkholderia sp. Ac-20345]MBN3780471.1 hypothetical protein [Burkholderia sp. Ac-20345]
MKLSTIGKAMLAAALVASKPADAQLTVTVAPIDYSAIYAVYALRDCAGVRSVEALSACVAKRQASYAQCGAKEPKGEHSLTDCVEHLTDVSNPTQR